MCRREDSLHHGRRDEAAVLDGGERGGEVSRVRGLHHLLVPVHHVQVAVELFPNLLGQLQKHKSTDRDESSGERITRKHFPRMDAAFRLQEPLGTNMGVFVMS